jgi:predicted ATPase/DNA-binding SARP family transcriptional activator/tetratricopeptide (TPR) repeat protein
VQVGILGPLEVRDSSGRLIDVAGTRLRAVLVRLALDAGRPVSVANLVDAVWGDSPPADEANALQTLVSRLRRTLGDADLVVQSPAGYRLVIDRDDLDANRFERAAAEGAAALRAGDPATASARLAEAVALWRGPAMVEVGEFAAASIIRLHDLRLAVQLDRIEADLALGRAGAVAAELDALAEEHPLHERLAVLLMTALARSGRPADALQVYERVRVRLAEELGVDPSPELQAVHLAVLRGELASGADERSQPPRSNLKAQLTSFVGREDEVARIGKSLEANRLVTIVGPGGAGKTRLASEAAARIVDGAPDGVWLVELAPVTDPADLPQTVLGSLGLREAHLLDRRTQLSTLDATSRLLEALADKRTVIVLDNCEHLVEGSAALVDHLLSHCPQLRVLTTSREPLGIMGEALLVVPPLGQPPADAPAAQALEYPAVRLFADRAAAVSPDFVVDDRTVATVIEIVRRLDGLPLAIELAAARLRTLPLAEIGARLSDRFRLLTGGSRTALPRHRTLRAVVEWSWDLLSPPERLLAERVAVFPAGATQASAAAVCADELVPEAEIGDLLASLVDKSLLQPIADGTRLRMLETIREYGVERLAERHELAAIRLRHATYFAEVVREAADHLRGPGQLPWMRLLEAERDNVLAALRFLTDEGHAQSALEIAAGMGGYWMFTGAHADAITWLPFALAVEGEVDDDLRLLVESMVALTAGSGITPAEAAQVEAGLRQLSEMEARFERADIQRYPMLALMRPVIAIFAGGDAEHLDAAIAAALASPDRWVAASALMFRAAMAENEGDIETMRSYIAAALAGFEQLGERWGLATCLQAIGVLQASEGDLDGARASYEQALRHVGELGAHDDAAWLHLRLADVYVRRGELARAADLARRGNEISEASGSPREVVFGRILQADIARRTGDLELSRALRDEALARLEAMPAAHPMHGHGLAIALAVAAKHQILDGEVDEARERIARAYEVAIGTKDMPIVASIAVTTALLAEYDGAPEDAAERLGAAAALRGTADTTQPDIAELTARLRTELGDAGFAAAYERGRARSRADTIEFIRPGSVGDAQARRR